VFKSNVGIQWKCLLYPKDLEMATQSNSCLLQWLSLGFLLWRTMHRELRMTEFCIELN
jgi:hypothetical protein